MKDIKVIPKKKNKPTRICLRMNENLTEDENQGTLSIEMHKNKKEIFSQQEEWQ